MFDFTVSRLALSCWTTYQHNAQTITNVSIVRSSQIKMKSSDHYVRMYLQFKPTLSWYIHNHININPPRSIPANINAHYPQQLNIYSSTLSLASSAFPSISSPAPFSPPIPIVCCMPPARSFPAPPSPPATPPTVLPRPPPNAPTCPP